MNAMNKTDQEIRSKFILKLVEKYGEDRTYLMPILQEIQKRFLYIDEFCQQEVAEHLNIHPVEIQGVISFYSFLYDKPCGRNVIRLCKSIICDINGSKGIAEAVKSELGIDFNQTTNDGRATLEYVNCFGLCDKSPSVMINGRVYESIDKETTLNLIKDLK